MPSPVLGIDLGTTNSVVAFADEHRVRVLRDEHGRLITPSTVSFEASGVRLVGYEARERRLVDARNTVFSVKRLLGRPFRSPEVQRAVERLPFALEEGATGGVVVRVRDETYSLPEIASFILRKVRAVAEVALGQRCVNAVITVPANFNELQRMATRDAGRIAGLNVLRILNEPTAAALAYGYRAKQGQRIAVYDLGGGTFDISILELSGDVIEVVATAGDTNLGGDDLDSIVADRMVADFKAKFEVDLTQDPQQYERVRMAAEWIKCQLSHQDSAEAIVKEVVGGALRKSLDLQFRLSRSELQQLVSPLITRTFTSCEEAMRLANVHPVQLDSVILVGGQTRTPAVREMVAAFFGREPLSTVDPELVVAQGAALQGYALSGVPAATLPSKPARTLKGSTPALSSLSQPSPLRASVPAPEKQPKRSDTPFDDLPTTVSFRGDPDDELTKVGEYVTAAEADAMFAAAQQADALPPPPPPKKPREPVHTHSVAKLLAGQGERDRAASIYTDLITAGSRDPKLLEEATVLGVDVKAVRAASPHRTPLPRPANTQSLAARVAGRSQPAASSAAPSSQPSAAAAAPDGHAWRSSDAPLSSLAIQPLIARDDASAFVSESTLLRSQFPGPPSQAPLLLDVTPHTLGVETTGGFCEPIIERNAPIPTEQTRVFTTSQDDQSVVSARVCQGESRRTDDNQVLGQFELLGLRKARRGEVSIAVTFIIDADGTLHVSAVDRTTGLGQAIRVQLVGAIGEHDLETMRSRQRSQRSRR